MPVENLCRLNRKNMNAILFHKRVTLYVAATLCMYNIGTLRAPRVYRHLSVWREHGISRKRKNLKSRI